LDPDTPDELFIANGLVHPVKIEELVTRVVVSPYGSEWLLVAVKDMATRFGFHFDVSFSALR
jgi:hypothetical protein